MIYLVLHSIRSEGTEAITIFLRNSRLGQYNSLQDLAFDKQQIDILTVLDSSFIQKVPSLLRANPSGSVGKRASATVGVGMSALFTVLIARTSRLVVGKPFYLYNRLDL